MRFTRRVAEAVWAIVRIYRDRRLPMPDLKDARGRRYDSPEDGHAPPDAPHIADDGTI